MTKIAILNPYFGRWPEWVDLYFYSCIQNPDIDFFYFTDCGIPNIANGAPNLHFYEMTFQEYCDMASKKIGIAFQPKSSYKLCGLRPFYGFIHEDILVDYDFWGFGDVDLVYGQIRDFYTEEMLKRYDVFSTHNDRMSGHFSLLRNSEYYRTLCFNIPQWQMKLQSEQTYALDEEDLSLQIWPISSVYKCAYRRLRKIWNWRDAWVTYFHVLPYVNRILGQRRKRIYWQEQHTTPVLSDDRPSWPEDSYVWEYKEGRVYNAKTGKEVIYLHFMRYKKNAFYSDYFWHGDNYHLTGTFNDVRIDEKGIFLWNE